MDLWLAGPETRKLMEELIAEYHPHLALIDKQIGIVMREPASKSGGVTLLGGTKKASPLMRVLGREEYIFVLEIAAPEWTNELSDKQRLALLDHLLCSCGVKTDAKDDGDGEVTYFIRKPEVQMFKEEIRRHGVWMNLSDEEDDGDHAATTIEKLFGRDGGVVKGKKGKGKSDDSVADQDAMNDVLQS